MCTEIPKKYMPQNPKILNNFLKLLNTSNIYAGSLKFRKIPQ